MSLPYEGDGTIVDIKTLHAVKGQEGGFPGLLGTVEDFFPFLKRHLLARPFITNG
jgi:hypothetical protein